VVPILVVVASVVIVLVYVELVVVPVVLVVKMIARQKDTGFGWKLEDFESIYYISAFTFFEKNLKNRKKTKTYFMPMHMSFLKLNSTISYFL
jgi:hypothetical protein